MEYYNSTHAWYGVASGLSLVDVLVIVVLEEGLEGLFDGVDGDVMMQVLVM